MDSILAAKNARKEEWERRLSSYFLCFLRLFAAGFSLITQILKR